MVLYQVILAPMPMIAVKSLSGSAIGHNPEHASARKTE
tara:strand:+ start:855 stop:968 length:114 start_codon:yes stop_codon:yes gene_type:complete